MTATAAIRARAPHYLSYEVASCAGMSLAELQMFISGSYQPTQTQLDQLAKRLGFISNFQTVGGAA